MERLRHECNTCKKTFNRKERLQKHIKQGCNHTTCKICSKKFRDGRSLQKHQSSHKPSKRECGICGRMFKSVKYLENHKKMRNKQIVMYAVQLFVTYRKWSATKERVISVCVVEVT